MPVFAGLLLLLSQPAAPATSRPSCLSPASCLPLACLLLATPPRRETLEPNHRRSLPPSPSALGSPSSGAFAVRRPSPPLPALPPATRPLVNSTCHQPADKFLEQALHSQSF